MRTFRQLGCLLLLLLPLRLAAAPQIELPAVALSGIPQEVTFSVPGQPDGPAVIRVNQQTLAVNFESGSARFLHKMQDGPITLEFSGMSLTREISAIPAWLSLLPPLLAILLALFFREVISSLFVGVLCGSIIIGVAANGAGGVLPAFLHVIDGYVIPSLTDTDHLAVILFSFMIGGMVAVISRNGGMAGIVSRIAKYAQTAKSGQLATWLLGIVIFFDDYANTLVVGNTMRPVTDRVRVSREKLSYIVDSTAAPVAAIAFVTTWIGSELSYIKDGIDSISELNESAYTVFLNSLAYSFYPIFTLSFILILVLKNRDFGPMLKAENRARSTGEVSNPDSSLAGTASSELATLTPAPGTPLRPVNAIIPVLIVVFGTIAGLIYTGMAASGDLSGLNLIQKISTVIGNANSYASLIWASLSALVVAVLLTVLQRLMNLSDTMEVLMQGFKTMMGAVMILVLAWSLALVTEELHTADYISGLLLDMDLSPVLLPAMTFILAALISFSTGSSWSTMAILYPLILPAGWMLSRAAGLDHAESLAIFHNLASCVLAGSVLGDHCSPISDTTILSSMASNCNHIDHVRTQLPYALTVGAVSVLAGTIPAAMGLSSWLLMPLGILVLYLVVHYVGKRVSVERGA